MRFCAEGDGQAEDGGSAHKRHDRDADLIEDHQCAAAEDDQRQHAAEDADQGLRPVFAVLMRAALGRASLGHEANGATANRPRQTREDDHAQGDQEQTRTVVKQPLRDVAGAERVLELSDLLLGGVGGLFLGVGLAERGDLLGLQGVQLALQFVQVVRGGTHLG